jgi:S1-C subfamily serine protease
VTYRSLIVLLVVLAGSLMAGCGGKNKLSQTELIDKVKPTVVRIQGKERGGSGVVIDTKRGLILTNAHVAVGLTAMKARVGDVESSEGPAQLVAAAPCEDLAVIKLVTQPPNLEAIDIGSSDKVKAGQHVTVLGYPGSFQEEKKTGAAGQAEKLVATDGTVSSANIAATPTPALPRFPSVIQHAASVNGGNSGGPLVDDSGKLVGINTLGNTGQAGEVQNQFYSISIDHIKSLLPKLEGGHSLAFLGWDLTPLSTIDLQDVFANDADYSSEGGASLGADVAQKLNEPPQDDGMYVLRSQTGSPAREANLGYGDLVETIEGQPVTKMQDVCDIISSKAPGEKVAVRGIQINSGHTRDDIFKKYDVELTIK